MPHAKNAARTAAWAVLALSAAIIGPATDAQATEIFSGASQTVTVSGTLPSTPFHGPFVQSQGWDSLNEHRATDLFWFPFNTTASTVEAIGTSGDLRNNGRLMSATITSNLGTSYPNPSVVGPPRAADTGFFSTFGTVLDQATDTIGLFTENPDDHRAVTLHKSLLILGGEGDSLSMNSAVSHPDFSLSGNSTLSIRGDGIGESPFGGDTFGDFRLFQDPKSGKNSFQDHIFTVDFALDMHLNEFRNFSIIMGLVQNTALFDNTGGAINQFSVTTGYSLSWTDETSVTDAATGGFLHGMQALSDSSFNYIGEDRGGPGEDLNAHAPPAGVPEPGAWALMLAGLGVAGAGLRRRGSRVCLA